MKPYLVVSDIHAHDWSQFSGVNADGVNTRLQIILDEMLRAATELKKAGGDLMVMAGDLFHQRGVIKPEVFNPTVAMIRQIIKMGISIVALPGNHDLASKETTELGNAFQSLAESGGFYIANSPETYTIRDARLAIVPWVSSVKELKETLEALPEKERAECDLFIHAGIDGVLSGVPAHGLTAEYLAELGFKRVFAGHYHHHVAFGGGEVYSIGALTHQTYSDIGTRAGFLLVDDENVRYCASHAPEFVEVTGDTPEEEVSLLVEGNYVRVRGMKLTDREIGEMRKVLHELGARGVSFNVERVTVAAREEGAIASSTTTLEMSVKAFVDTMTDERKERINERAQAILREAREMSDAA
jgi:DNA repair exonuclease SbcCD nuclease subunit